MDWQQHYETGNTPWDRGRPAPALVDFLTSRGGLTGDVLVPGCGSGWDLLPLAENSARHVTGIDIAPLAVAAASARAGAFPAVTVLLADLFTAAHGPLSQKFDWVWEHTCYCAIPPDRRPDYVRATAAALRPGGQLLGVFFLNPWDPDEDQEQGPPFGTTEEALTASFAPCFQLVESWRPAVAFTGREGRELMRLYRKI